MPEAFLMSPVYTCLMAALCLSYAEEPVLPYSAWVAVNWLPQVSERLGRLRRFPSLSVEYGVV